MAGRESGRWIACLDRVWGIVADEALLKSVNDCQIQTGNVGKGKIGALLRKGKIGES